MITAANVTSILVRLFALVTVNAISFDVVTASIAIEADKFCSVNVEDAEITSPAFIPLIRSCTLAEPDVDFTAIASIRTFCLNALVMT